MIGSRVIGTRWLGSGRTQRQDYIELSGSLDAVSSALGLEAMRATTPVAGSVAWSASFGGGLTRLRGLSGTIQAVGAISGPADRQRPLGGTLQAVAGISGSAVRQRPLSGSLTVTGSLDGSPGRLRNLSGSLGWAASVNADLKRLRGVGGSLQWTSALSSAVQVGISLSGTLNWSAQMSGRVVDLFSSSPPFRLIYVPPKDRDIFVAPKERAIIFAGDDQGLSMEERIKQPSEIVDYTLDMRDYFRDIFSDFITDVVVTIDITGDPDDLESGPDTQAVWQPVGDPSHQAKMWFGGGIDGKTYQVTALVTTNAGRVEEVDFLVVVEEQ